MWVASTPSTFPFLKQDSYTKDLTAQYSLALEQMDKSSLFLIVLEKSYIIALEPRSS